eukprot:scaffold94702_cov33-Phaeocystis_antarctica.AAC.1
MSAPLSAPLGQRATPSAALSGLNFHVGLSVCTLRPPKAGGGSGGIPICVQNAFARARTQAHAHTTTRRWALAQRRHVSLKRSAGSRRAVSMLVPLSEGSARAEQWEPSSVTAQRSRLHLSGAREVPLARVVGEPRT